MSPDKNIAVETIFIAQCSALIFNATNGDAENRKSPCVGDRCVDAQNSSSDFYIDTSRPRRPRNISTSASRQVLALQATVNKLRYTGTIRSSGGQGVSRAVSASAGRSSLVSERKLCLPSCAAAGARLQSRTSFNAKREDLSVKQAEMMEILLSYSVRPTSKCG